MVRRLLLACAVALSLLAVTAGAAPGVVAAGHRAPAASLVVTPTAAEPGASVRVAGRGFSADKPVRVLLDGQTLRWVRTNRYGRFATTVVVPQTAATTVHVRAYQRRPWRAASAFIEVLDPNPPPGSGTDWTMLRAASDGVGANLAEDVFVASALPGAVQAWQQRVDTHLYAPPVVAGGVTYVGSAGARYDEGGLTAYATSDGTRLWRTELSGGVSVAPAVGDGVVVAADAFGTLTALSTADGSVLWSRLLDQYGLYAPPTIHQGRVYLGVGDTVRAVDLGTGADVWEAPVGSSVYTAPAVQDGTVYVTPTNRILALDLVTGDLAWDRVVPGFGVYASPTVSGGSVYAVGGPPLGQTTPSGTAYAFDTATGETRWNVSYPDASAMTSPVLAGDTLFVALSDGSVHQLDTATGQERWVEALPAPLGTSAPVQAGDVLYAGANDGNVYALATAGGVLLRSFAGPGGPDLTQPVVADGRLFIGSDSLTDGLLRVYGVG